MNTKAILTIEEAMDILAVSRNTVIRYCIRKQLSGIKGQDNAYIGITLESVVNRRLSVITANSRRGGRKKECVDFCLLCGCIIQKEQGNLCDLCRATENGLPYYYQRIDKGRVFT